MDLGYIHGEDLADLELKFPTAYHFLLSRALRNEWKALPAIIERTEERYQAGYKRRLRELDGLFAPEQEAGRDA